MSAINDNALTQIKDSIGGLLHLGPNVLTFRTLLHLELREFCIQSENEVHLHA